MKQRACYFVRCSCSFKYKSTCDDVLCELQQQSNSLISLHNQPNNMSKKRSYNEHSNTLLLQEIIAILFFYFTAPLRVRLGLPQAKLSYLWSQFLQPRCHFCHQNNSIKSINEGRESITQAPKNLKKIQVKVSNNNIQNFHYNQ